MRLQNSLRNMTASIVGQSFSVLFSFSTRVVFVRALPKEYLGIEGLFSSILMVLSLTELGIGGAIVYSLYKPLAENDQPKIRALMNLYKKAYIGIGIVIAVLGFMISFNLPLFIKRVPDIKYLQIIFLIFVLNSAVSYLFSYKGSLIAADQKNYIVTLNQYTFNALMCIVQIVVLLVFHSYWGFILVMLSSTILQNISIAIISNRLYPYQNKKPVEKVDSQTMGEIKKNTAALIMHSFAGVATTPITNMILSTFVGLGVVAVYSNYLLITNVLTRFIGQIFNAITAPVGNMGVTETNQKKQEVFMVSFYINAVTTVVIAVPLLMVFSDAIKLFFGRSYQFPLLTEILIVLLFLITQLRFAALSFTSAFGLYWHTRYKALIEAITLTAFSYLVVQKYGLIGILIVSCLVKLLVSATIEGYMLYKYGIHRSSRGYFLRWAFYILIAFILATISVSIIHLLGTFNNALLAILVKGTISTIVTVAGFFLITFWLPEFRDFYSLIGRVLTMIPRRKKR